MKPQFQHEITTSFALWMENYLLKKGEAFSNKNSTLQYVADDRLGAGLEKLFKPIQAMGV